MAADKPPGQPRVEAPPGAVRTTSWRPKFHYELIDCGLRGHELLGTDVARIRPADELVVREPGDGLRWHRCLRCDSWVPLPPPESPSAEHLADRSEIQLPLRGRPLRDRYVLRLIALDRLVHFLVLGGLAVLVFLFVAKRTAYSDTFYRVLDAVQGALGGPEGFRGGGLVREVMRAFTAQSSTLYLIGLALAGYAVLEGVEAVGLWLGKRWAEYLTLVATALLLIPEVYELTGRITVTKIITLVINLAVVAYLLFAKRLFGLRGGGRVEAEAHQRDTGWQALERSAPSVRPSEA
ncbi:MAG TPA: DUF2127 domain-containing protein [Pseudonocardia sp.]|uniref:DUF2127 domain-containing protein n=1 Tax=Pseudonocardia sp. TaxID=60912 RepID=UPI002EDBAA92